MNRSIELEVRTPDGELRFYTTGSYSEKKARLVAIKMIAKIVHKCQDDRVLWKLSCDRDWSMGARRQMTRGRKMIRAVDGVKANAIRMKNGLINYFFDDEETA